MGMLNGIMLASLGRREMVIRLAVGFRELLDTPNERGQYCGARSRFQSILSQSGRREGLRRRRRKKQLEWSTVDEPVDGPVWNSTVDKELRDYIRATFNTDRCESKLVNEVGFEALRQALIARDRNAARAPTDPLHTTDALARKYRIGARWAGDQPHSRVWSFEPRLAVAWTFKCFIFRTPAGLVAVKTPNDALESLLARLVLTKREIRIKRFDNGVFVFIDGEKMTLPAALIQLGLAEARPMPNSGAEAPPTSAPWTPPTIQLIDSVEIPAEQPAELVAL